MLSVRNSSQVCWPRLTQRHRRAVVTSVRWRTWNRYHANTLFPIRGCHDIKTMILFIHKHVGTLQNLIGTKELTGQSQRREINHWTNQNLLWQSELVVKIIHWLHQFSRSFFDQSVLKGPPSSEQVKLKHYLVHCFNLVSGDLSK